jgi:hypothetical protein
MNEEQQEQKPAMFLTTVGEQTPVILCEKHAKTFEQTMIVCDVPHTIIELDDDEDTPKHCHACDLVVAKEYAKMVEQAHAPKIVLPGEF